jgi:hypothetical protein
MKLTLPHSAAMHAAEKRFARSYRALKAMLLAMALVVYGSTPCVPLARAEVQSEIQEEATPGAASTVEFRGKLRRPLLDQTNQSAVRQARVATAPSQAARLLDAAAHLPAGLALPLRC